MNQGALWQNRRNGAVMARDW